MKGYPIIVKKPQKHIFDYQRSRTYKSAYWKREYQGPRKYVLHGDEVKREPQCTYRITWNKLFRDERGQVRKPQYLIANINHWGVVEDFKEWLQYRQGEIERNPSSSVNGFTAMKRSHLPGKIPDLEGAIQEYLHDGSDLSIEEGIEEKVFGREVQWTNDDLDFVMLKVLAQWIPIKESIVRSYVDSEEFRVWLDNQVIKKAGPRESPKKKAENTGEDG